MAEVKALVRKIAQSEATTVLLRGESGTGKDVIARAIHAESNRASRSFMNITCTALQETLLESELFGHERGSFTDAKAQKRGLFEMAAGGTVFLDEIGDMTPTLQSKLLRALEEKTFRRIGGTEDIEVDVRMLAATNRDLEKAVQEGRFREDLYYRLNVIPVVIAPLRERKEDIPLLVEHFLTHFGREFRKPGVTVSTAALEKLAGYRWPGNIRELRNVIERAMLLSEGTVIRPEDLLLGRFVPGGTEAPRSPVQLPEEGIVLEDVERELVRQALERTHGNQTRAAELLGITRDQIRYRMEKFGMLTGAPGAAPPAP
jgi:transcriptional regulator with PAS, ATPase and Fis domain